MSPEAGRSSTTARATGCRDHAGLATSLPPSRASCGQPAKWGTPSAPSASPCGCSGWPLGAPGALPRGTGTGPPGESVLHADGTCSLITANAGLLRRRAPTYKTTRRLPQTTCLDCYSYTLPALWHYCPSLNIHPRPPECTGLKIRSPPTRSNLSTSMGLSGMP